MKESVETFYLRGYKGDSSVKVPTVHIARGYERNLPILSFGRPIVCISDWQCETPTQRYFWTQAWRILRKQVGTKLVERALVIVAGDMASKSNDLRGAKSDAVPDYSWLQESFPQGDILIVYGNHDFMSREHLEMKNKSSGLPCLLPHGGWVGVPAKGKQYNLIGTKELNDILDQKRAAAGHIGHTSSQAPPKAMQPSQIPEFLQYMTNEERRAYYAKQAKPSQKAGKGRHWEQDNPEQAHLVACFGQVQSFAQKQVVEQEESIAGAPLFRVGAVHGIPASHMEGVKKVERTDYFQALSRVCEPSTSPIDILVTHSHSCFPGQEHVVFGDDPKQIYECFLQSQASLHVCGHMHLDQPITIVSEGKVVVNTDCRVVVFVPPCLEDDV